MQSRSGSPSQRLRETQSGENEAKVDKNGRRKVLDEADSIIARLPGVFFRWFSSYAHDGNYRSGPCPQSSTALQLPFSGLASVWRGWHERIHFHCSPMRDKPRLTRPKRVVGWLRDLRRRLVGGETWMDLGLNDDIVKQTSRRGPIRGARTRVPPGPDWYTVGHDEKMMAHTSAHTHDISTPSKQKQSISVGSGPIRKTRKAIGFRR